MHNLPPVNFLESKHSEQTKINKPSSTWKRRVVILILTPLLVFLAVSILAETSSQFPRPIKNVLQGLRPFSMFRLVASANRPLKGEEDQKINILLLGIGGGNHDGAQLTDTIIVGSLDITSNNASLLSLPRDMVAPFGPSKEWRKVNAINSYAEEANPGTGAEITRQELEKILDIQIPYVARVDFSGFSKLIDSVGGLDIYVDNTLEDPHYPVDGRESAQPYESRFEHLLITKGQHHFDGATALKYARSRYGLNGEGSDFARSRRQQKVLLALKDKLISFSTLFSPSRFNAIKEMLSEHVQTNITAWEAVRFAELMRDVDTSKLNHVVIDDSPSSPLIPTRGINGAYILMPKNGNFNELQQIVKKTFSTQNPQASINKTRATVSVFNGTNITGLASRCSAELKDQGLLIGTVANAPDRNYQQTMLYDRSNGKFSDTIDLIKNLYNAKVTADLPNWLENPSNSNLDIGSSDLILVTGPNIK